MTKTLVHAPYTAKRTALRQLACCVHTEGRHRLAVWMESHRLLTGLFCFFGTPILVLLAVFAAAGIAGVLTQVFMPG
ncbi:MAG: hypothetical protein ACLSS9_13855 [Acutalibacteraceae bacterium]